MYFLQLQPFRLTRASYLRVLSLFLCVYNLRVQTGKRKHLAARRGEDLGGQESGNPPSLQVRRLRLRAKEKSSESHPFMYVSVTWCNKGTTSHWHNED